MRKFIILFLLFISSLAYSQVNLTMGLKAYYPFTGNANDVSGNNNNPIFNNATLTADRLGNPNSAYHFDGISNYMQIPNSPTINTANEISLCAWVRPMGYYAGTCHGNSIMNKGDADFLPGNYYLRFSDGAYLNGTNCSNPVDITHQNFHDGSGAFAPAPGYTPYIQTGQWYSVIVTHDATTAKLYVNCELKFSGPVASSSFTNAYDLFFGRLNSGSFPYWLTGDLDDVRIYDRAINQDEVNVLGGCAAIAPCDSWLKTQATGSYATVGDVDVSGNQLTVEASFNRTSPANSTGGYGFLVSKHTTTGNINYSIWPNGCAISTTTGDVFAMENCGISLNKTYHVAMVYNGSVLKFYRNGFLMNQTPATGNLLLNDLITTIGQNSGVGYPEINQFLGNINEVRIWNVARTQAQLQTYMNTTLPAPTTQAGLLGYYVFDNLLNKQGNAAYNGTLFGGATINNTNPNCNFIADSCAIIPAAGISHIINDYTPVLAFNPCANKITVEDAIKFNTGDTVLIIQMKGAAIDSTNTATFGTITDYKNVGNYEFNYVKSKAGNIIELKNKLTRQYDIPAGKVQLIRVPYFNSVTISDTLTCLPWDGSKGGVLVLNARDTVVMNADINTTGKGFLKGIMRNSNSNSYTCDITGYYFPDNTIEAAGKGEGISFLSTNRNSGIGPAANGGGGGLNTNSGGGGGSNGNKGGRGGYEWNGGCPNYLTSMNWGLPGNNLLYNNSSNKIFMGGAGGAGHCNNQYDAPTALADFNGGNGGGLIIINSDYIRNNNKKIISKGDSAYELNVTNSYITHDGMGGGGAGGTVLLNNNNYINNLFVDVSGGKGGNLVAPVAAPGYVGPGGGGGAGVVWVKQNLLPANLVVTNNGGNAGVIVQAGNINYGAAPGLPGINVFSLSVPFDNIPFSKNIDSVRIKDSSTTCLAFDFKGFGYTNTNPITTWQWDFGDVATANTQNTSHTYASAGTFTLKLTVTDINGCKDSIIKNVISNSLAVDAGSDSSFCNGPSTIQLHGTGTGNYSWAPPAFLNNNTLQNPTATINATTTFYLTVTNASGCIGKDSVTIFLKNRNNLLQPPNKSFCSKDTVHLDGNNGNAVQYLWSPSAYLSNTTIFNPIANPPASTTYTVKITDTVCNFDSTFNVLVTVKPLPAVKVSKSNDINCSINNSHLTASGAVQYIWASAASLSSSTIANPVATPTSSTQYVVTGTDNGGCKNTDSISVLVVKGLYQYDVPNSFTPNGDGNNECFGVRKWDAVQNLVFIIYNRWGVKVFETNHANICWDGTYKGSRADIGNYVYYISAKTSCGDVVRTGNVLLIR